MSQSRTSDGFEFDCNLLFGGVLTADTCYRLALSLKEHP